MKYSFASQGSTTPGSFRGQVLSSHNTTSNWVPKSDVIYHTDSPEALQFSMILHQGLIESITTTLSITSSYTTRNAQCSCHVTFLPEISPAAAAVESVGSRGQMVSCYNRKLNSLNLCSFIYCIYSLPFAMSKGMIFHMKRHLISMDAWEPSWDKPFHRWGSQQKSAYMGGCWSWIFAGWHLQKDLSRWAEVSWAT